MQRKLFDEFLQSPEYLAQEKDVFYIALTSLLSENLSDSVYLEVEEILHSEILTKVELGFKYGLTYGVKVCSEKY